MTREELKREAKEYADKYGKSNFDLWDTARFAYYQGAEPREKQIAELTEQNTSLLTSVENLNKSVQELEAEVKEWKDKADLWCKTANLKDHNIMINKELEKENAELKSENQKWKDEWQEQVQKATDEGYERTLQTMQLNKAKVLLKQFLEAKNGEDTYKAEWEAEQFLNSEVEK